MRCVDWPRRSAASFFFFFPHCGITKERRPCAGRGRRRLEGVEFYPSSELDKDGSVRLWSPSAINPHPDAVDDVVRRTAEQLSTAKKALRALKAFVKLQALVRGYLVRKQAAATLHSTQALIRARATERYAEVRSENMSSFHRRLSASLDNVSNGFDRSPKIVEIGTCRPKSSSSSRRTNPSVLDLAHDLHSSSISSPLPCQIPARIPIPDRRNFQEYDWCLAGDKCRLSLTTHSTPRYMNSSGNAPVTPTKSVFGADGVLRRFMNVSNCPNYIASTQSFEAKSRSQSAPKQRPEPSATRKRLPLSQVMVESRASLSGSMMQRSCTRVQEAFNFKTAAVGRLDRESYLQRKT
ncbi:hypothetical protein B296_00050252 [Ensete ventricosum]|uniref:DUF4005 domain-containing protein n=1 Tax=Ensete ventricosum TaxID=4639 RepID=A0A426YM70_ENSVE|nr:hypothetical protein B296_00050252 [Ensete ventricosum]